MINTRQDLDSIAGTPEHAAFISMLEGSLWRVEWDDNAKTWRRVEDNTTIERFGFTREDFPNARAPDLPAYEPELSFSLEKSAFIVKVDADADAIYASALGNRETEYKQAEAEASAFRAAGYSGQVPEYVKAWATAKGESAQWAADSILATATAWRATQAQIRTNRLACKEAARAATTAEELAPVVAQWDAFVVAITTQLRTP